MYIVIYWNSSMVNNCIKMKSYVYKVLDNVLFVYCFIINIIIVILIIDETEDIISQLAVLLREKVNKNNFIN